MTEQIAAFFSQYGALLGTIAACIAILEFMFKPIRSLLFRGRKPDTVALDEQTVSALAPRRGEDGPQLTVPEFIRIRREFKQELLQELSEATDAEKEQLRARIAELEKQIADPEPAFEEFRKTIAELEERLARIGNDIGGDRLNAAREAMERGDFSIADDIFAEVEMRRELEVKEAARAAFGRGEIAEEEVRWLDAADHYARAARLDPNYDSLLKAGQLVSRAGRPTEAIRFEQDLLTVSRREFGDLSEKTAAALNNLAESFRASGDYKKAEPLFLEALEIGRNSVGVKHSDYATRLNNLAVLFVETGRVTEAEQLYREALKIELEMVGDDHTSYSVSLNNLAGLLVQTRRFREAEPLLRDALEITRNKVGVEHPSYAIRLNNLARLLEETDRLNEAEPLYREAMEIDRKILGDDHPDYAVDLNNIAGLLSETGRFEEAEVNYRNAIVVFEKALGPEHPKTQTAIQNLVFFKANKPD